MKATKIIGFTLVEMMIVVAVIAMLVVLAIPAFTASRTKSITQKCIQNHRAIYQGVQRYELDTGTTLYSIRSDGVAIRNTLVTNEYVRLQSVFECPASASKDYDDYQLRYKGTTDFTNTHCTISTAHILQ